MMQERVQQQEENNGSDLAKDAGGSNKAPWILLFLIASLISYFIYTRNYSIKAFIGKSSYSVNNSAELLYTQRPVALQKINLASFFRNQADSKPECGVCFEKCTSGDILRIFPCMHKFHEVCIGSWINRTPTCPICRKCTEIDTYPDDSLL